MQPAPKKMSDHNKPLKLIRKQHNPQIYNLWFILGLPLILSAGAMLSWGELYYSDGALPMISLVGFAYLTDWIGQYKTEDYRAYKVLSFSAFYLTVAYILIIGILAFTRAYYSRTFLASTYILFILWNGVGMLFIKDRVRKLLILSGGIANKLKEFAHPSWIFSDSLNAIDNISEYDGIVLDLHSEHDKGLLSSLATKSLQGIPIIHAATVYEEYSGRTSLHYLAHEGIYKLGMTRGYEYLKRFWELILVSVLSVLLLPVFILTIIGIKMDTQGPVFFNQVRVGKNGKLFTLYKFRSMDTDSEDDGVQFASERDHRITKFGKFIRKYRIDELPQFWNILKGDMNLIGPRPEQQDFVDYFKSEIPFYVYRHKVRPGITGWAQVKGGYADDIKTTREKLEYDLYYVKNLSLSLDLLIAYATVKTVITGYGSR